MIGFGPLNGVITLRATLNPQPDGTFTVSNLDGTVVSVQPDGSEESRPGGTAGPFEKFIRNGEMGFFFAGTAFNSTTVHPYVIVETLPND